VCVFIINNIISLFGFHCIIPSLMNMFLTPFRLIQAKNKIIKYCRKQLSSLYLIILHKEYGEISDNQEEEEEE